MPQPSERKSPKDGAGALVVADVLVRGAQVFARADGLVLAPSPQMLPGSAARTSFVRAHFHLPTIPFAQARFRVSQSCVTEQKTGPLEPPLRN